MLETIKNAWRLPELRKRILYTLFMIVIFRLGSVIPVPLLDSEAMKDIFANKENTLFGFIDTVSGGAFQNATIFAMSITPYINASIIMQLLCVAIPALERMQKEGEEGRKKIAQMMRYGTVVLAIIQGIGLYFLLKNGGAVALENQGFMGATIIVITFTAGTAFLMWLGDQITEKGIGNGISLIIFAGIVSRGPMLCKSLYSHATDSTYGWAAVIGILLVAIVVVGCVVLFNDAERRIPVQYSKRVVGRKMYGGQSTHIPIKVTSSGVMPIIFAMSIMAFPGTICSFFGIVAGQDGFWGWMLQHVFSQTSIVYGIMYFLLILFFTYFYSALQFNPIEMANNMKQNGGFVPGVRPGRSTSELISRVLSKITLVGAIFLGLIAVLPIFLNAFANIGGFAIGGTSLLIVVGVALETVKQLESQMLMRHYKGFLE